MRTLSLWAWLLTGLLSAAAVAADGPRGPGEAPAIELFDAVSKAKAFAKSKPIDLSRQYLQSASFDTVKLEWTVVWQVPNAKGGRTDIIVPELGPVTARFGE